MDTASSPPAPSGPGQVCHKIEMIGEEFVTRLKTEPETEPEVTGAGAEASASRPSVVMSVSLASLASQEANVTASAGAEQPNLVYCNLNDLEFSGNSEAGGASLLTSGAIGDTVVTSAAGAGQQQLLQMVQAVPGLQVTGQAQEKSPYNAVSTILLQGGILQLKPEGGSTVSSIVNRAGQAGAQPGEPPQVAQVLHIPVDQKISPHEIVKVGDNMVSTQLVTSAGNVIHSSRPQDAIANILASMNSAGGEQGEFPGHDVVQVIETGSGRAEVVPLNLATTAQTQSPGAVQVQGYRKVSPAGSASSGGQWPVAVSTKKVIIATINGQQRILTPVSSPQLIAVKNPNGGAPRLVSADQLSGGQPLTILQPQKQPLVQKQVMAPSPAHVVNTSPQNKTSDNKTCRWKFENGQICGKQFTKTYNLTVHMRMHQDIRPFPCTICEQTFRQKAHLQRHEATHGIDSTAGRKRRKKSLLEGLSDQGLIARRQEGRMSESEEEDNPSGALKLPEAKRPKVSIVGLKTETDADVDPMIEPIIEGSRKMCPVTVGTNTEKITPDVREADLIDDLEEDMEPVRYKGAAPATLQVEQGVQYCEADLLPQEEKFTSEHSDQGEQTQSEVGVPIQEFIQEQEPGPQDGAEDMKSMKTELVYTSQGGHYVTESGEYIEDPGAGTTTQLITADGSFIDASSNHLVMGDGALVSLVSQDNGDIAEQSGQENNVVNIVTSTATNEQGQQIIIIDNLDQHSPELQREIMNALLADHTIVPISQ